jgi:hypothetical protein
MNDSRRKRLEAASQLISQAISSIEEVREEEQEAFDNLPENMQEGEKGEAIETAINTLDDALSALTEALSGIDDAQA